MAIAKPKHDYDIHETPGVCGGYPCVGRTRIPVRVLVEALWTHGTVDAVVDYFPQLSRAQVEEGLAYYRDSPDRVNEDIVRNAEAWEQLTGQPYPLPHPLPR